MVKKVVCGICAAVFAAVESFAGAGLPKEYQEVEWIGSDGTQCINNLGYARNAKTSRLKVVWYSDDHGGDGNGVCGTNRGIFGDESMYLRYNGSSGNMQDATGKAPSAIRGVPNGTNAFEVFFAGTTVDAVNANYKAGTWDKTFSFCVKGWPTTFATRNLGVFCYNNATLYKSAIRLLSFQIWESDDDGNEVLVRDFVPCYRASDHVAGLFEASGNSETVFYANQSTTQSADFTCGPDVLNSNKIIIAYSRDDIPDGTGASPACGMSDLTPGEEFTALVANPSVLNPSKTFRYTVTGWERIVRNAAGTTVTSNGVDDVSTCTFTPAEGDEVYLTWIWKQEEASASKFQVRDASGDLIGTTYTDLAAAFAVATNGCAVELLADSVWDAPITITDKSIRLKSVDGARYTLTRISADASFILNQETTEPVGVENDRILLSGSTYFYPAAQLIVTNLVINCGSQDGVSGGIFALLKLGHVSTNQKHINISELKLENGAEICCFETEGDYLVKREDWQSSFRMRPGSWIHHISGEKGIYGVTDTSTHGQRSVVHIEGAKISDCTVTGDSSALLYLAFSKAINWNTIRFVDAVITNNLVASDFRGTVYLSCATTAAGEAMFNIGGNVRITDNFLLDGVTPANVRINTNTKMDIHQKLGDEACIGLKRRSNDAMVDPVEGAEIGFVTPTTDKGKANAIYYDGNTGHRSFFGKIVDQTVVWSQKKKGLMLILR